jgi:hypothetical protein
VPKVWFWGAFCNNTAVVCLFLWLAAQHGLWPPGTRLHDHTRPTTVGRTPLDKWSARRRDLYLTTHTTDKHQCPWWDSNP